MLLLPSLFAFLAVPAAAWLPGEDKDIYGLDGANLFNRSTGLDKRSLPAKVRGVNLGSLFVLEPWMASQSWAKMGCSDAKSEFDCVLKLGQDKANAAFQGHWGSWITKDDISTIKSYGLNTIRIPVGYWMHIGIVDSSEHFPQGALKYLSQVCGWASDAGLYIIIDMHGAPGAQLHNNADTGQNAPKAGFYNDYNFDRGVKFLSWLTKHVHTDKNMRNVGMIEVLNEPDRNSAHTTPMRTTFYPNAYNAIRKVESDLKVGNSDRVHVEMMNELWWSGDPKEHLPSDATLLSFDDHRYLKWAGLPSSRSEYLKDSCHNDRNSDNDTPTIVGEFSISPEKEFTEPWDKNTHKDFYKQWFAAMISTWEKDTHGWIFWNWKTELGDYRWSYSEAVEAGVIPKNPEDAINSGACNGI